jgi:hypothetical protein
VRCSAGPHKTVSKDKVNRNRQENTVETIVENYSKLKQSGFRNEDGPDVFESGD